MAKVILFGLTEMSEMMHYYLTHDSPHQVVAFTVDERYLSSESFCNLPVLPFETIEKTHPPAEYEMGILLGFRDVNRLRAKKYAEAKAKGYRLISYISSKAIAWPGVEIGENTFVFEQSVLMPFSRVGNDVFVSLGCLVGHHSTVADHTFLSAHVVLLGCVNIGSHCILGANATIKDLVTVADSCVIGIGTAITRDTRPGQVYVTNQAQLLPRSSSQLSNWVTWTANMPKNRKAAVKPEPGGERS
jgi:sugar O-acyltransferase (sialic acid O-acetyltransferase NeuD family)